MTKKANILIVEDSLGDILLMTMRLKEIGHECCVHVCKDGDEALAYLDKTSLNLKGDKPDLIILDYNLPKRSGSAVLAELRKMETYNNTPVVMFSSSAIQKDVVHSYAEGANCYIVKPVNLDEYNQAIDSIYNYWLDIAQLPESK